MLTTYIDDSTTLYMTVEEATQWAAALRSGEYEQTTGGWGGTRDLGFCCLQVAADLHNHMRVYSNSACVRHLGLTTIWSHVFVDLNDEYKLDFSQIADVVDYVLIPEIEAQASD